MRLGRLCSVLLLGLLWACKHESSVTLRSSCFDACVDASANIDIEGQLAIATDIRDSLERARAGFSSYASVSSAVTQFVQSLVDLKSGLPSGLSYTGAGTYKLQANPDTSLELRFYLPANTSYGTSGDLIQFNLFDASNYFASLGVKATTTVSLSGISTSLNFTFDKLGPGAELLGIGASASSPIPIDLNAFSSQLSKVLVGAKVNVTHVSNASSVSFGFAPGPLAANAVGNAVTQLSFVNFVAENAAFEQSVSVESASLTFGNSSGKYVGEIYAKSTSPDFGFMMKLSYDIQGDGDIELGCLGVTL